MPKAGEWLMAYKVASYIIDEGYSLSKAVQETTRDVDAGKTWVPDWAVTRVARWIASGDRERPGEDELPHYMIEERAELEACLLGARCAMIDSCSTPPGILRSSLYACRGLQAGGGVVAPGGRSAERKAAMASTSDA